MADLFVKGRKRRKPAYYSDHHYYSPSKVCGI